MVISKYFQKIGVPLVNDRWSWGSVRDDGLVVLRVWQDEKLVRGDKHYYRLSNHRQFEGDETNLGYQERNRHIALLREGARCCLVMCRVANPAAMPRTIKSYIDSDLFIGGEVIEEDGDSWVCVVDRLPWKVAMGENS